MQSETVMPQKIGLVLFWVGAVFMFAVGFLSSWWVVPAIRESGINNLSAPGGATLFWGISAPLGAMLAASMGSLVSVFLVLGWGFMFFGHRISLRARAQSS